MKRNPEKYRIYMNAYMKNRYMRRREEALAALGGICNKCGSKENLEFDHINSREKEFTLAKASSFSEIRWQKELLKCQLLCRTCHTEKHKSQAVCGTVQRYWRGCRCRRCTLANALHCRAYKKTKHWSTTNGN